MQTNLLVRKPKALLYSLTLLLVLAQTVFGSGVITNATDADLRAALVGGGTVTFATSGTIVLTNTLSIANSTIVDATGHTVVISGGNAFRVFDISASGALTLSNLTVANGWDSAAGGFLNNGSLTLINCTISSNTAFGSPFVAGGILNGGTLFASGCTFVGNVSSTNTTFGAQASALTINELFSSGAFMSLVNCTFFGNSIPALPSGPVIYQSRNKSSFIINCTIAGRVQYIGPPGQGSMTLRNTIAYDTSGDTNSSNNLIGPNPGLGPLADNGGPTLTMALLPDSPAINAANVAYAPPTDQRGFARPYGAGHDIGAFETVFIGTNAGVMRFTSSNYDVLQTNGSATITVYRDYGATGTVSVHFATSDGTAIAGQDYTATNGTLTFSSGEISKSFTVPVSTQPAALSTKTVNLTLTNPTGGATLGVPSGGVLNILPTARLITSNDEIVLRSAMASGGVLMLAFDGTMSLTSPLIASTTVALDGAGHNVTISGSNSTRLFEVQPGATLSLVNLTLADGLARGTNGATSNNGGPGEGGAVYSSGNLSALNVLFLRNTAQGGEGGAGTPNSPDNGNGGVALGGAVFVNGGALNAINCTFDANRSLGGTGAVGNIGIPISFGGDAKGGAIHNQGGAIQLFNCVVSSNHASGGPGRRYSVLGASRGGMAHGGAICGNGGDLWVIHSTFATNTCTGGGGSAASGGAIHQDAMNLYFVESVLQSNKAAGGQGVPAQASATPGGGAYGGAVSIAAGATWLTNSTLTGNLALGGGSAGVAGSGFGGAIYSSGTMEAVNSTVAGNIARSGTPGYSGGSGLGGGLYNNGGVMTLDYVTVAGNSAEQVTGGTPGTGSVQGGGIYLATGTTTLHGTIVANNFSGSNVFGTLVDNGYNLSSDPSCNFTNTGSLNNVDPLLYPLGDFGGPTPTMPLLAGSPAIDAGDPSAATSVDQRGVPRPFGSKADMGAYEWNGTGPVAEAPAILINPQPATVFVGGSVALSVTAQGYQPLQYSWRRDGSVLAGANGTTYSFSNALSSQSGAYTVVVTNVAGAITSAPALVRVKSVQLYHGSQMLTNGTYQFASPPTLTIRSAYTNGSSFYTVDGSTPSFASTYYSGPFVLSQSATVRAIGYSADFSQSDTADTVYADVLVNHTLTVSTTSGGTVSLNPPGGTYIATNIVTATAQPAAGWYFLYWLGDASGANPSVNVSMERDKSIHAVFGTTLSTTVAGGGTIQVWPPGGVHPLGTTIRLTAISQPGNYFGFWGNAATGNTNPLYFTITGPNQTVSSIFAPLPADQSALTVLINGRGQVNANPRANAYLTNQSVTLTAVPDAGQNFLNWSGDASGTQNPLVVSMAQSRVITANFSSRPWLRADRPGVEGFTPTGFRLTVVSDPQTAHEIRASTNLNTWLGLGRVTNDFGEVQFTDTNTLSAPAKFYQAAP